MYLHRARHLPASSPYRFADARDVPADLALPVFLQVPLEVTDRPEVLSSTALLCAHKQHLPVERCFLPPGATRALRRPFEPEFSVQVARCVTAVIGKVAPVRAAKVPGRKDPCTCGCGKKFKRCCADCGGAATDPT